MSDIIKLENITKRFDRVILDSLNLRIEKNTITVIKGISGAGKSTLLNILGLIDSKFSGDYYLDGILINNLKKNELTRFRNKKISYIFQAYNLINNLTVYDNLTLPLLYNDTKYDEEYKRRIDDVLRELNILYLKASKASILSGGEKQRVSIARAILMDTEIVIADEPTGNLDKENKNILLSYFKLLKDKYGKTIIIVTHDDDMLELADNKYILSNGKIYEKY